jgi:hypothetical protein
VDACLWIITRHTIDGAIMFNQFDRTVRQATPFAHVPVFVQNGRQFSDPFQQRAPLQARCVFGVQTLSPRLKQAVDRFLASLRLDKLQRVDQKMVVCFGEERLSSSSERVQMAGTPYRAPHATGLHQPVTLQQRQMLTHTNRTDAKLVAQLASCHRTLPPQKQQYLLARFSLFAVCHQHSDAPRHWYEYPEPV